MPPVIRLARPEDAPQILAIYAPYVLETPASFELVPPSLEEMRGRIAKTLERLPWIVCVDGDEVMGYAYAGPYRVREAYQWSLESTVYVHKAHHRRGVGAALYTSLFQVLRLQGYLNVFGVITQPNPASVRLHESLGFEHTCVFRHVGHKLGKWHDVGWWQLALRTPPKLPEAPMSLGDVQEGEAFLRGLDSGLKVLANQP